MLDTFAGISVRDSYGIWSSAFGAASVWLILRASRRFTARPFLFSLLFLSGGFAQLYFGDVENYTAVSSLILAYCLASIEHLEGEWTLFVPSILLSLAVCFHLLSGWLAPTMVFLLVIAIRSRKWAEISLGSVLAVFILAASVVLVGSYGLLPRYLGNAHAAATGSYLFQLDQPVAYWGQMFNLLFLLFPSWGVLLLLLLHGRIRPDRVNIFLGIATVCLLSLALFWRAGLWPYNDWNLYACLGIPASLLCWRNFLQAEDLLGRSRIGVAVVLSAGLHSACWIVSNHFFVMEIPIM